MNSRVCFDASVAVKWLILEDFSELALSLLGEVLRGGGPILAPPHLQVEVSSALYKRVRTGDITLLEAQGRISNFSRIPVDLVYSEDLSRRALELALSFGWKHPYDAFYLAVGDMLNCEIWTADVVFHRDASVKHPRVHFLADYVAS